ncbi:MAG: helix-turn-helix transcriptional regulator [Parcubacteria group bacterium]|jgi:putative transcriptional regulator
MDKPEKITNTLKYERKKRRVTQAELATALGVSRQTIVLLEKGNYSPSLFIALKASAYFHEPIENLFQIEPIQTKGSEN